MSTERVLFKCPACKAQYRVSVTPERSYICEACGRGLITSVTLITVIPEIDKGNRGHRDGLKLDFQDFQKNVAASLAFAKLEEG